MTDKSHGPHPSRPRREGKVVEGGIRYSRGYLPHYEAPENMYMVTYRLADALPASVVERQIKSGLRESNPMAYRKWIEQYLDAGHGACWLAQPAIAGVVRDAWLYFDRQRYFLHGWVIMPNHVHLVVALNPPWKLADIVKSWKAFSASRINQILGRKGTVWQREYFDRYIRNHEHFQNALNYMEENPVKAGLVDFVEQWKWRSGYQRDEENS